MRLIDADELKKQIAGMAIINNYPQDKANALCELIDLHPTEYDIDKVVEKLEGFLKSERKYRNIIYTGNEKNPVIARTLGRIEAIEKSIEIVKQGCVSDDCCEWQSVSDGEFIQNPHTKRLYSNEPSMKNIYCNTCGKKIKVV